MLNLLTHGDPALPKLLIAHGLFGSGRNWGVIAKRLADRYHVLAPDLRNHGDSPWFDSHSYDDLAQDLAALLDRPTDVVGHSMGGKAAMVLAVTYPDLVNRLIVADIAPVAYAHSQSHNIAAMRAVDLSGVARRSEAGDLLQVEEALKPFLLQSLDADGKRWKLNLDVLDRDMDKIVGFPELDGQFDGPALFLSGADSDYLQPAHRDRIKALFPAAKFAKIPGAGHWLHAEKPREFEAALRAFLEAPVG
ncbi:MAG: putative hydrolases or acyltransferases (alpha/beta hydrolase superfamily) [Rhodobacteraceae bacterium HLUCCA08]|nr:MAG: putative hydrolases or acyltransferases (alpha/beta hydrolase superfamily) [Rhodobacteraceae bacterium HLUCCA08]